MPRNKSVDGRNIATESIRCEECRHFTGLASIYKFGCSKGHAQEIAYLLIRSSCPDNAPLSRPELIFRRFGIATWGLGANDVKNRQVAARRTATALRKTAHEFERFLSSDQAEAFATAASALDQLGADFEVAAKMAAKYKADKEAEYERLRMAELDAMADGYFGNAAADSIVAVARSLQVFFSNVGLDWYRKASRNARAHFYCGEMFDWCATQYERAPNQKNLMAMRRSIAKGLERLTPGNVHRDYCDATVADFERFRVWQAEQAERASLIAADPKIIELKPVKHGGRR